MKAHEIPTIPMPRSAAALLLEAQRCVVTCGAYVPPLEHQTAAEDASMKSIYARLRMQTSHRGKSLVQKGPFRTSLISSDQGYKSKGKWRHTPEQLEARACIAMRTSSSGTPAARRRASSSRIAEASASTSGSSSASPFAMKLSMSWASVVLFMSWMYGVT